MEKRAHISGWTLPLLLILPQMAITVIFFYWPASQAIWQSFLREDAFGLASEFVGFENYVSLFEQSEYYRAMVTTAIFSSLVAFFSLACALLLATQADKNIRGGHAFKTFLIWPYAVAPAIAGVLWLFMFHPTLGTLSKPIKAIGIDWNPMLNANHAMTLLVLSATWKQISYNFLFFLAGLQAIPKSVIEDRCRDGRRPRRADHDPGLQGLCGRPSRRRSRRLGRSVGDSDDHRDRAHRHPVPLCRAQGAVLMVENRPFAQFMAYLTLALGVVIVAFPVYLAVMASTFDTATIINGNMPLVPGDQADENYTRTLLYGGMHARQPVSIMMFNSMIMAMGIAIGKILISILSAYAVVYFKFPFRKTAFWIIFITLMLPVEVRIYPTYKIVADLGLLDTYTGLIMPLIASATGTLLFRQFFMTIPDELLEASKIDGAGAFRFFKDTHQELDADHRHRHQDDDHHHGCLDRVECCDDHRRAGHAAAGARGDLHAEALREGSRRNGEVTRRCARPSRLKNREGSFSKSLNEFHPTP
ncbi:MAG: glycerol-3-phosphate transporter permease [Microvirga sp.]|nr:glycerol-3-phosphate transporter permease [Microvirga sp.]